MIDKSFSLYYHNNTKRRENMTKEELHAIREAVREVVEEKVREIVQDEVREIIQEIVQDEVREIVEEVVQDEMRDIVQEELSDVAEELSAIEGRSMITNTHLKHIENSLRIAHKKLNYLKHQLDGIATD
jgi:isopropylmalate/homocitrate/citramalate synthase